MQTFFGLSRFKPDWRLCVVCIGTFDGVHLGHRHLLTKAVEEGRSRELPLVLCTFDRHPLATLKPGLEPPAIQGIGENLREFEGLGIPLCVVLPFDRELADTSAEDFLSRVLIETFRSEVVVLGHDFAFGRGRQGTAEWLADRIETVVVEPFFVEGDRVSSTLIREAIATGRVERAARLLGRAYSLDGVVVSGRRLGRTLGFPTVNLALAENLAVPADGVYAGRCVTALGSFVAAISVGTNPTVGDSPRSIEAFLMDYPGDSLYGTSVTLAFHHLVRPMESFPSLEALREQMGRDTEQIAKLMA